MQYLRDRFHAIFIQEVALAWSILFKPLLPQGWTLFWGVGCCAVVFKYSDWAADPAAAQEDVHMFPDDADRGRACRHWRRFMKAG